MDHAQIKEFDLLTVATPRLWGLGPLAEIQRDDHVVGVSVFVTVTRWGESSMLREQKQH